LEKAKGMICAVCPKGMEVISLLEPTYKSGKITSADFTVAFAKDSGATRKSLTDFFGGKQILVSKKPKKGEITQIDVKEKILKFSADEQDGALIMKIKLPAGGNDNINPKIIISRYLEVIDSKNPYYDITRTMLYVADGNQFK
jgi:hypothetical protein